MSFRRPCAMACTEQIPRSWLKSMSIRRAFLRGAFLGGGSVNKPQSDYHLSL